MWTVHSEVIYCSYANICLHEELACSYKPYQRKEVEKACNILSLQCAATHICSGEM